jgi:type II secretory pathway component GspD/PulD (secretin)
MIFLRPTVIRDTTSARGLTTDRYDYVIGTQKGTVPETRWFWPDTSVPELPESQRPAPK